MKLIFTFLLFTCLTTISFSQKGKNGAGTISATGTVVNTYTSVTSDLAVGALTINVVSNMSLTVGDLIMIIQMQGASMDINTNPITWWGGNYSVSNSTWNDLNAGDGSTIEAKRHEWGTVTNYNNAGKYELAEVISTTATSITVRCGLKNAYTASGHVQVVKIPRYTTLTLNPGATIVPAAWNGTTGGVVALEVDGNINFGAGSKISATGFGFRGGVKDNSSNGPGLPTDIGKPGYVDATNGAEKGEGIGGSSLAGGELDVTYMSRYGCGAPANGGGGGNYKNAGGGGGANVGTGTYNGKGVPNTAYTTNWNLELLGMAGSPSAGGGRGGYSGAQSNQNENTMGPNNSAWQADSRRKEGGLGGHALTYDNTRVFMGGGGGAGEMDNSDGGSGGAGGGIVFVRSFGTMTGNGVIEANGNDGENSNPTNANAGTGQKRGIDAAGGAGGGGAIIISNGTALPASITLNAIGGKGGDNNIKFGSFTSGVEADGPGGGGGGGMIAFTSGTPTQSVAGGANGIVTATGVTNIVANFPPNGATSGNVGMASLPQSYFNLVANNGTTCSGSTATISVTVQGTLPVPVSSINWYSTYTSTISLGTGLTFTTPILSANTTYYVGFCEGTFRIPVTVTVGGPSIDGTPSITNATCSSAGSISGLSVSGGTPAYTYAWNGVASPGPNLASAPGGNYTLVVTDASGCKDSIGPLNVGSSGGPVISTTNLNIVNANCLATGGSITGITATGTGLSYSWNSGAYTTLDITNITSGAYTIVVTDNLGCTATYGPINVGQDAGPSIDATGIAVTNTSCGLSNGAINGISATGTGLSYSWNSGAYSTLSISGLASGNYNLTVTDNIGCTDTYGPVAVAASSSPAISTVNISITQDVCGQSNGTISGISVSGGLPGYTYSWNSGAYSTQNLTGLTAGAYTLIVTDAANCKDTVGPLTVTAVSGPTISTTNMVITDESCTQNDGSITGITVTGGTPNYTYSWNSTMVPSANLSGASDGSYTLTVIDQNNCVATAGPFTIDPATPMSIDQTNQVITPTGCVGNTGSISGIVVVGGINPTVSWSNGATTIDISSLAAGNYTLTVTDDQNCLQQVTVVVPNTSGVTISTATSVVVSDTCNQHTGEISGVAVSGGTAPYQYQWDGSTTLNTLDVDSLQNGNHTLVVTDASGCTATTTLNIPLISGPTIDQTNLVVTNENCIGNNGAINGIQIIGNGPFTYVWVGSPLTSLNISNLNSGSYSLTVFDANGCSATSPAIIVNEDGGIHADFSISNPIASPNEEITFTDQSSGGTVQSYAWNLAGTGSLGTNNTSEFTSGVEGVYSLTLTVVSTLGCKDSITKTFEIRGEISIPNIVTANGDQVNDEFIIKNLKPNSKLIVVNRWGNEVWKTDSYANDWKGLDMSGNKLEDGVYFYQLITPDGKMWQGNVQLLIR